MYYDERKDVIAEAPVQLEPWRKTLLQAADYIREYGWCQGQYYLYGGPTRPPACMLGAIMKVGGYDEREMHGHPSVKHLACYLQSPVPAYNDADSRTKEQVIAALEGAAKAV